MMETFTVTAYQCKACKTKYLYEEEADKCEKLCDPNYTCSHSHAICTMEWEAEDIKETRALFIWACSFCDEVLGESTISKARLIEILKKEGK